MFKIHSLRKNFYAIMKLIRPKRAAAKFGSHLLSDHAKSLQKNN